MTVTRSLVPLVSICLAVLLVACGGTSSTNTDSTSPEVRTTQYGNVQGINDSANSGTYWWKGVPFAKPPVGDLRWKAPVEPDKWSGTLATQKFGNACIQNGALNGPGANDTYDATVAATLNTPVGSEDCLTLNIWRPAGNATKLPVIFYVYGGEDISGYSGDPALDGAALAKGANAVVVTTNYRLGPFGFLNLAQLKTGSDVATDSGDFGLLDIVQGLKFVKNNIASFGGDAGNVTLMGQSAGATNTWALLTSPLATGLFEKAVPMSGSISLQTDLPPGAISLLHPASYYLGQANGLLTNLLIADGLAADTTSAQAYIATQTNDQIAAYLRGKDAGVILTSVLSSGGSFGPVLDGTVVPVDPIAAIAAGNYNKVPVLAGNTAEEAKAFASLLTEFGGPPGIKVSDAALYDLLVAFNPDVGSTLTTADIIDSTYLPVTTPITGYNAKTALLTSMLFPPSTDNALNTLLTQQPNVWHYQFNWAQEPAPWNDVYGAAHAFDIPFMLGNFGPSLYSNAISSAANKPGRLALSSAMMASLAAFARTGDPNNASLGITWQPWPHQIIFDATQTQLAVSVQ